MCGQRFVQAVASLVLIVESSHRYQNVATSVYFNLKKKSLRFCHILALKFHFRQWWLFESAFRGKATRWIYTLFAVASLVLIVESSNRYQNLATSVYF